MPTRSVADLRRTFALACLAACSVDGTATAQEIRKPQLEHQVPAADEGTRDATIRTYEKGPDAEPSVSRGWKSTMSCPAACGCSRSSTAISAG